MCVSRAVCRLQGAFCSGNLCHGISSGNNHCGKIEGRFKRSRFNSCRFSRHHYRGAKIRAMEIIDELENDRRNLYTGSMGYFSFDGNCDLNIVIRTAVHKDNSYYLGVGGGITCESDLEFEYEETLQKARAVLEALWEEV